MAPRQSYVPKAPVKTTHFDDFVREATNSDPCSEKGLDSEELFGLYTSWCLSKKCPRNQRKHAGRPL